MCARARVVVSTVGPYALYGEPLVKLCAQTGTDYCDLTGEVQWIRRMIERYEPAARASGARIVHCCGFDSIPSDLGVWFLQQEAARRFAAPCSRIKMRVKAMRGGASGGTVASMLNVVKEAAASPALRKELANPYSLCGPGAGKGVRQPNVNSARWDEDFGAWCAPFVMAAINTRVVHRSNALQAAAYGADFRYDEAMLAGRGARGRLAALGITAGLGAFMLGAALPPARWLLERFVLPAPGEGPSPQAQRAGFYDIRFYRHDRRRPLAARQGHGRSRSGLRFDFENAGRSGCVSRAGSAEVGVRRRFLDTGDGLGQSAAGTPAGPCRPEVRTARSLSPRGQA